MWTGSLCSELRRLCRPFSLHLDSLLEREVHELLRVATPQISNVLNADIADVVGDPERQRDETGLCCRFARLVRQENLQWTGA